MKLISSPSVKLISVLKKRKLREENYTPTPKKREVTFSETSESTNIPSKYVTENVQQLAQWEYKKWVKMVSNMNSDINCGDYVSRLRCSLFFCFFFAFYTQLTF